MSADTPADGAPRTRIEIERRVVLPGGETHMSTLRFELDGAPVGADLIEALALAAVSLDREQARALGEAHGTAAGLALLDAAEAATLRHLRREAGEA